MPPLCYARAVPCNDITEVLRLELDAEDRLLGYSLTKRTCGAPIGDDALLLPLVRRASLEELTGMSFERVTESADIAEGEEFLFAKHWVALQEAAAVLLGRAEASPAAPCTTVCLSADGDRLGFEALIRVEALTERIQACGNCCKTKKKPKPAPAPAV